MTFSFYQLSYIGLPNARTISVHIASENSDTDSECSGSCLRPLDNRNVHIAARVGAYLLDDKRVMGEAIQLRS